MSADDEFRKVAEDLRTLARALRSEVKAAKWEAKAAARDARRAWRWDGWQSPGPGPASPPPRWWEQQQPQQQPGAPEGSTTTPPPPPPPPPTAPTWGPPWGGRPWPWGPYHHHHHGPQYGPPPRARTVVAAPPPAPPAPPPPPVRHKRDGSTLLSLLLVLAGLAWLGSASGVVSLSFETVLAAVLVVLGAGMVITARTDWSLSRRHWPVWLGIAVLVLLMVTAGDGGLSRMHFGATTVSPTADQLDAPVRNFAGPITVTLPKDAPTHGATLHVQDVFGPIDVIVPANAQYQVVVDARSRFGPVNVPGANGSKGVFSEKHTTTGASSGPVLTLDVTDVFGPVTVTQGS